MTPNASKQAIAACILSLTLSFTIVAEAWMPSYSQRTIIRNNGQHNRRHINKSICVELTDITTISKQSTKSATQLSFIKFKDTSSEPSTPIIELTTEQDQILRDVTSSMEDSYGIGWFEESESWEELKVTYPTLKQYTNDELCKAFIARKPTPVELLVKPPLGPFLLLNGILWLGGFSWCDTPFYGANSCLP